LDNSFKTNYTAIRYVQGCHGWNDSDKL